MWLKGVDVFVYAGGAASQQAFFEDGSMWQLSKAPMHRRIIVTTMTVGTQHPMQYLS